MGDRTTPVHHRKERLDRHHPNDGTAPPHYLFFLSSLMLSPQVVHALSLKACILSTHLLQWPKPGSVVCHADELVTLLKAAHAEVTDLEIHLVSARLKAGVCS